MKLKSERYKQKLKEELDQEIGQHLTQSHEMDEDVTADQETPADLAFYKFVVNVHVEHQQYLKKSSKRPSVAT